MLKNFKICQKLNYYTETPEKQLMIDNVISHIRSQMINGGYQECQDNAAWVFSVGGDGTMLHSMHTHQSSTVIGVNAGNFGFLTPYSLEDIFTSDVISLIENQPRIEKRSILSHELIDTRGYAVNEYTLVPLDAREMLDFFLEIEHNGQISQAGHYNCISLVVSGPCGSTAYNMNAGGAIIDPVVQCMQIVMIAPTSLGVRPLIISHQSKIHIKLNRATKIFSDGVLINEQYFEQPIILSVSMVPQEVKVLVPTEWNFFNTLSEKLYWNNGRKNG